MRPALERFNADGSLSKEEIDALSEQIHATNDMKAVAAALRAMAELPPDRAKLEVNTVPCMCVIGEHDTNLPAVRLTAEHMANLELKVVDGENHITAFQSPEFIAAVKTFLAKHSRRTSGQTP